MNWKCTRRPRDEAILLLLYVARLRLLLTIIVMILSYCMQVIATAAGDIVQRAVSEAMESPELPPEDLFSHVYCESNQSS